MKKTLAFLLTLMLLFSLSTTAFADTGGSQTITLTVPDSTTTEITPTVQMTLPVFEEHPVTSGTPSGDNASNFTVSGISFSKDGTVLTDSDTFEAGDYTVTISVAIDGDYVFSSEAATVKSAADENVTYSAARATISENGKTATYTFTYNVAAPASPSWTMTIPADLTIKYGATQTQIIFSDVKIENVKNLPDTMRINASFQFTGSFENTDDSSKTIPFTVIDTTNLGSTALQPNSPQLIKYCHYVNLPNTWVGYTHGVLIDSINLSITSEAWAAAAPGRYQTDFTYSSAMAPNS